MISRTFPIKSSKMYSLKECGVMRTVSIMSSLLMLLSSQLVAGISLEYTMTEETPANTRLGNILDDSELSSTFNASVIEQLRFSILKGKYAQYFAVHPTTHELKTSDVAFDRDTHCPKATTCQLKVKLAISRPTSLFSLIQLNVLVEDINDNPPAFSDPNIDVQISENANPGATFSLPAALDPDSGAFGTIDYHLVGWSSLFSLEVVSTLFGESELRLVLSSELDREHQHQYTLELQAVDGGEPPLSGSLPITVVVSDMNDNHPEFDQPLYNASVPENYPLSTPIVNVHATDKDSGDNGLITYSLSHQSVVSSHGIFDVDPSTGDVYLKETLDYEEQSMFHLTVIARDQGHGSQPTSTRVLVYVRDVNDITPQVTVNVLTVSGGAEVMENVPPGEFIAHISVEDGDGGSGGVVSCNTSNSHMFTITEIEPNAFKVLSNATFDRELDESVTVDIVCSDNGMPPRSTSESIEVNILDQNDNAPVFTQNNYTTSIRENGSFPQPIFYVAATDQDVDINGRISYYIQTTDINYLKVDPASGLVSTNARLDREVTDHFEVNVYAVDQGVPSRTSTAIIRVAIEDINDERPIFTKSKYVFGTFENQAIGTEIGAVTAIDRDTGPRSDILYTLTAHSQGRSVFRVDATTGNISTKRVLDREVKETYVLTVMATNTVQPYYSTTSTVSIHVADKNDNAPAIAYPNKYNNTVHMSAYAKGGTLVAQVLANDVDVGKNAMLAFQIGQGNNDELFVINPASGEIFLERSLKGHENVNQTILLVVQDQGTPVKSSVAPLTIVFDHSLGAPNAKGHRASSSRRTAEDGLTMEVTIVIIVGCLSVVLAGCLAALLVYLCRRPNTETQKHRGCEMTKDENGMTMYSGIRITPEDGMEEIAVTPLTSLAMGEQSITLSQCDGDDMWISDEPQRPEDLHLDSGHGSWAESGSECGTVALEYGDTGASRGYYRRPVYVDGQDNVYKVSPDVYSSLGPRVPMYHRQVSQGHPHAQTMYVRHPGSLSPTYEAYRPVPATLSPTRGHSSLRPPAPPPRRTAGVTTVPLQPDGSKPGQPAGYSMDDLMRFSGNKVNVVKNQFPSELERDSEGKSSTMSSFSSNSGFMASPTHDTSVNSRTSSVNCGSSEAAAPLSPQRPPRGQPPPRGGFISVGASSPEHSPMEPSVSPPPEQVTCIVDHRSTQQSNDQSRQQNQRTGPNGAEDQASIDNDTNARLHQMSENHTVTDTEC